MTFKHLETVKTVLLIFFMGVTLHKQVREFEGVADEHEVKAQTTTDTHHQNKMMNTKASGKYLTLAEIKKQMMFPCNYVHDGFYFSDAQKVMLQNYDTIINGGLDEDTVVPIMIEAGGHDGITKSISLQSSICLNMNVLMIEASPLNYNVLSQSRKYDTTVNAALCNEEFIFLQENKRNSGENKVVDKESAQTHKIPCTSLDKELHKIQAQLPQGQQLVLIMMVLDIEGHEVEALKGLNDYKPKKAYIEIKFASKEEHLFFQEWETKMGIKREKCGQDDCFGFTNTTKYQNKEMLYGARNAPVKHHFATQQVSSSYMFYGK